jgi:hypothetical protein
MKHDIHISGKTIYCRRCGVSGADSRINVNDVRNQDCPIVRDDLPKFSIKEK